MDISTFVDVKMIVGFISLAGIGTALKIAKSLCEFHGIVRKQSIGHSDYLITQAAENKELISFLNRLKAEQIFLSVFRIRTSPTKMRLLMELYETGCFSMSELRACFYYAYRTNGGDVDVKAGALGWFSFISSAVILIAMALMVGNLVIGSLKLKSVTAILVVVSASVLMYLFILWFVGRDVRDVITTWSCRRKLAKLIKAQ